MQRFHERRATVVNPQHLSKSAEWYTPTDIIEAARLTMGAIHLDPASSAKANERVKAERYFTKSDNSLAQEWRGRVFLNPPGDPSGKLIQAFWKKLVGEFQKGHVSQAVWVGFNLNQLQTLQKFGLNPLEFSVCFPRKRLHFVPNDREAGSPTHANYICYMSDTPEGYLRFQYQFGRFGTVLKSGRSFYGIGQPEHYIDKVQAA